MHKLRQYYHQNKNKIKFIVAFIIFIVVIIPMINNTLQKNRERKIPNNINISNNNEIKETNTQILSEHSAVTGDHINTEELNATSKLIDEFVSDCNNRDIEKAYSLLSDECKKVNYKDIQSFKKLYYDKVFNSNTDKNVTIENWIGNTYRVNIYEDIIVTGKASDKNLQDYITIIKENEKFKLNINSFVRTEKIDTKENINGLVFNVIEKKIYMDYVEYTIKVENKTNNTVLLDTQKDTKTIYLQDANKVNYYSYSNEIMSSLLRVNNGFSTQVSIKFGKRYSSMEKPINSIVFSDVLLDINNEKDKKTINIEL